LGEIVDLIRDLDNDNRDRDAYSSINGYFYQFELTLLHILNEGSSDDAFGDNYEPAEYQLETIEDYTKYFEVDGKKFIRVAQIKHYTTEATNSKYYDAVLWLYYNFLKFLEKNPKDIEYSAYIFHYDTSPDKNDGAIFNVLKEAIASNERKVDAEKRSSPYKKIMAIAGHNEHNLQLFCTLAKFKKCDSFSEVTAKLKSKLKAHYHNVKHGEVEWLYAAAVSKLIHDGKEKIPFTIKRLDEYVREEKPEFLIKYFYKEMIIEKVFYEIEKMKGTLSNNPRRFLSSNTLSEPAIKSYEYIYDMIKEFLKDKFQVDSFRMSFLHSVAPKQLDRTYSPNSLQEYEAFLECVDLINKFVSKLAKIMYFIESTGHESDLETWFFINDEAWLCEIPGEQRGRGVLMGDCPGDPYHTLLEIIPRFGKMESKPDVVYLSMIDGITASNGIKYTHDITEIDDGNFIHCDPAQEHFHIQCLQCLSVYNYEDTGKIAHIFLDGCTERKGS